MLVGATTLGYPKENSFNANFLETILHDILACHSKRQMAQ
jgi:hypothetical protein